MLVERPQLRPVPGALAFSEHLLGLAPISTPVILATGDPLLAYNLAFFLAFPLGALGAHQSSISRRHDIAFLLFCLPSRRIGYHRSPTCRCCPRVWMPVALGALHRYFERRARWLVVFAAAWLSRRSRAATTSFSSVLIALWLAWFGLWRGGDLVRVMAAWTVAQRRCSHPCCTATGGSRAPIT